MKKIILVVGMSGSGKDYNLEHYNQTHNSQLPKILTTTSRLPRPNEFDGVHYHFVDEEFFKTNKDDFIEQTFMQVGDARNYYGLQKKTITDNPNDYGYLILEPTGFLKVQNLLKEKNIPFANVFFTIDEQTQIQRILQRDKNISIVECKERLATNQTFDDFFKTHKNENTLLLDAVNTPNLTEQLNNFIDNFISKPIKNKPFVL